MPAQATALIRQARLSGVDDRSKKVHRGLRYLHNREILAGRDIELLYYLLYGIFCIIYYIIYYQTVILYIIIYIIKQSYYMLCMILYVIFNNTYYYFIY